MATRSYESKAKPFIWVSLVWLLIGTFFCLWPVNLGFLAIKWFLGLSFLCLFDFLSLSKTLQAMVELANKAHLVVRMRTVFSLVFWSVAKLICLGLFIVLLMKARSIHFTPLFLGVGTLLVVPWVGGLLWRRGEVKYA